MSIFEMVYEMDGVDGVRRMADIMAAYDGDPERAEIEMREVRERAEELLGRRGWADIPEDRKLDIRSLAWIISAISQSGMEAGVMASMATLSIAYGLGAKDARLEAFKSAEVKDAN